MKETVKQILILLIAMAVCWLITVIYARSQGNIYACEVPEITEPCGMSTEELKAVLKYDLIGYAEAFLRAEEDYGINACFLASVAAHESGWGRSDLAKNKNNLFGWKGNGGYKEFDSAEGCIDWVTWKLCKKYTSKGLDTLEEIAPVYCDEEWAEYIREIWGGMSG